METWRQRLAHEAKDVKKSTAQKIKELEAQLKEKNTYIHHFQTDNAKAGLTTSFAHKQATNFAFDKVHEMDKDPDEMNANNPKDFCQKCHRESRWCKHRKMRDDHKEHLTAILTTSQGVGWRDSFDNFELGNKRVGHCKRTFADVGHL